MRALQARKKHQPIHDLWNSIKTHTTIPSTFDGTLPEFAFSNTRQRLIIGDKYIIADTNGNEQTVELLQAVVNESNKSAWTFCKSTNGQIYHVTFPLTDLEVNAYK